MKHTDLRTRRTFPSLAFANHMNGLVTSDCTPGSPEGAEMLTRADPTLDRPMILLQNIAPDIAQVDGSSFPPAQLRISVERWPAGKLRSCRC